MPEIDNEISTKDQILKAYNKVLEQIQQKETPEEQQTRVQQNKMVEKVYQNTQDNIVSTIAELKIELNKQLDTQCTKLSQEFVKLT